MFKISFFCYNYFGDSMKLSIIIPVYNTSKYLRRCLDSVLNQTYKDLEIIVINDGSNDDSLSILNEYANKDERIKVIDKKNEGVSIARNKGLEAATGELIAFVDSDDAIVPDMYEVMIDSLIKYDASISVCDIYRVVENKLCSYGKNDGKIFVIENPVIDFLLNKNLKYAIANKVFKKGLVGDIKFDVSLTNSEDRLFIYEIYRKKPKVVKINIPKYIYYLNSNSASAGSFNVKHESILKSANIIYDDVLLNYKYVAEANRYLLENLIILIRKIAISPNRNEYIEYYNNIATKIIKLSKKVKLNKKRKLEVFIIKYIRFFYSLFVKKIDKHNEKIDISKVKDDLFIK